MTAHLDKRLIGVGGLHRFPNIRGVSRRYDHARRRQTRLVDETSQARARSCTSAGEFDSGSGWNGVRGDDAHPRTRRRPDQRRVNDASHNEDWRADVVIALKCLPENLGRRGLRAQIPRDADHVIARA